MKKQLPSASFYVGIINGVLLSLPLWGAIVALIVIIKQLVFNG